jgi:lipopolysaccharide transport system permease protein
MEKPAIEILPAKTVSLNFGEIWRNRELLFFFTWRDIKVKYKQTYLGILWAIVQPLFMTVIFYLVFANALQLQLSTIPYPLFAYSGLLLWGLFHSGISQSSESMISNANIIRKIYFPRLIIPLSSLFVALIDFLFAFIILIILLVIYKQPVSWTAVYCFPLGILMAFFSAFGMGILMSALNVKYRDFRYLLPFLLQVLFFASQVLYSIDRINNRWLSYLLYCHPFNGALEIFRLPLQPGAVNITGIAISVISLLFFLLTGLIYFRKTEAFFADLI